MIQFRDAKRAADARELKAVAKKWAKNMTLFAVGIFVLLFAYGSYIKYDAQKRTPEAVARIHARTVTMEMVEGKNLPPMPVASERDATVAGVDVNQNGVRDDVEIEIFKRHPNEPKVRAAQLQYAMALQSQLTEVFSEGTLVAALQEVGRAGLCIDETHQVDFSFISQKDPELLTAEDFDKGNTLHKEHDAIVEPIVQEVEVLTLNTDARRGSYDYSYKFMTGFSGSEKEASCDVQVDNL